MHALRSINRTHYRFLLYNQRRTSRQSNSICLHPSVSFRSIEHAMSQGIEDPNIVRKRVVVRLFDFLEVDGMSCLAEGKIR